MIATDCSDVALSLSPPTYSEGSVTAAVPVMMGREVVVEARDRVCFVTFRGKVRARV